MVNVFEKERGGRALKPNLNLYFPVHGWYNLDDFLEWVKRKMSPYISLKFTSKYTRSDPHHEQNFAVTYVHEKALVNVCGGVKT